MKTQILTFVFSVTFALTTSFANNNTGIDSVGNVKPSIECAIFQNADNLATLIIDKPYGEKIAVKIYSEGGELMSYRNLKRHDSLRIRFDLSNLPKGNYTIKVVKADEVLYSKQVTAHGSRSL
jgi:hypothetical protein